LTGRLAAAASRLLPCAFMIRSSVEPLVLDRSDAQAFDRSAGCP
jgi:hypothetical protein